MLTNLENNIGRAWIDISVPIYSGMVHWPDNPPVHIERMLDLDHGDAANVSKIELGAHTGTHMDAPRHFFADGAGLDEMPLEGSDRTGTRDSNRTPSGNPSRGARAAQPASRGARAVSHPEFRAMLEKRPIYRGFCLYQCRGCAIPG